MSVQNIQNIINTHLTSPHIEFHKYQTPHSNHNIAPTHHTPHAHPTHSSASKHIQLPPLHTTSHKHATQSHTPESIPNTHKRKRTTRARTPPAAIITTPELSPGTATGVRRAVVEPSPICAHHKASQPHHKPAHPTLPPPLHPFHETSLHLPVVVVPPTP